jgi:hypothetical protein
MTRLITGLLFALKLSICFLIGIPLMLGMTALALVCGYTADAIELLTDGRPKTAFKTF